jgi:hypothetical protein
MAARVLMGNGRREVPKSFGERGFGMCVSSVAVLLLLLLSQAVAEQSQPPSPTPLKVGQEQQNASPAEPADSGPDRGVPNRSTAQPALPVAPQPQAEPTDGNNQPNNEAPEDWRIVWFTGILTLVAVLQFIAMIVQSKFMRDGLIETKKAAEAAKKSANAAKSTLRLNRPWLITRDWEVRHEAPWVFVAFAIENTGTTTAMLAEKDLRYVFSGRLGHTVTDYIYEATDKQPMWGTILAPGQSEVVTFYLVRFDLDNPAFQKLRETYERGSIHLHMECGIEFGGNFNYRYRLGTVASVSEWNMTRPAQVRLHRQTDERPKEQAVAQGQDRKKQDQPQQPDTGLS